MALQIIQSLSQQQVLLGTEFRRGFAFFLLILLTDRFEVSEALRMAVIVGFLGAFTTFSTFEMEIYGLTSERSFSTALLYLLLSVVAGFVAVLAGVRLARLI